MVMKFKIGDFVKPTNVNFGKRFVGQIWDCVINKPENMQVIDGEYVYVVQHYNCRSKSVITYRIKESELVSYLAPQN